MVRILKRPVERPGVFRSCADMSETTPHPAQPSQPAAATSRPGRRTRVWAWWAVVWLVLTCVGTVLHWATWMSPEITRSAGTLFGEGLVKVLANAMVIPASPGWIITTRIVGRLDGDSIGVAACANGVAWLLILAAIASMLGVGRRIIIGPKRAIREPAVGAKPAAIGDDEASGGDWQPVDIARRRLILRGAVAGTGAVAAIPAAYATMIEPWNLITARYSIPIRGLPRSLHGLRVAMLADMHMGPRVTREHIINAVRSAIDLRPDVFVLVGDYVHREIRQAIVVATTFEPMVATGKPVIGVLGNHDWYAGARDCTQLLTNVGVRLIDNSRVFMDVERQVQEEQPTGACLCIAGVGDLLEHTCEFDVALRGVRREVPRIVLSHNPDAAEHPQLLHESPTHPRHRVDLMLCGHTHGGQVKLPFIGRPIVPSRFGSKYAYGVNAGPVCPVLTTAGIGMSILPLRLNVPPEIVLIELIDGGDDQPGDKRPG
jgi:predicted MPP superfamily phosphohydrolase